MKKILFITSIFLSFAIKAQVSASPNPFINYTTFTYTITAPVDTASLLIYNQYGQHISTPFNDTILSAGTYSLNIYGTGWAIGSYIFSLTTKHETGNVHVVYDGTGSTGINQISNKNTTLIYPNPATNYITINSNGLKDIKIYDLTGRVLKSISTSENTIPVSDLYSGIYFLQVYSDNKLITNQKVIIK